MRCARDRMVACPAVAGPRGATTRAPTYRSRDERDRECASTCLFVDWRNGVSPVANFRSTFDKASFILDKGRSRDPRGPARTDSTRHSSVPTPPLRQTTRVLTSQIYKCATLHANSSGCPAVQHSVEILDGERLIRRVILTRTDHPRGLLTRGNRQPACSVAVAGCSHNLLIMRRGYTRGECTHVKRVRMVAPRDSVSNLGLIICEQQPS